jgi:hypothetical protein
LERFAAADKRWRRFCHLSNYKKERVFKNVIALLQATACKEVSFSSVG